ncbi:hypothetical protein E1165_02470 [Micromonospora sp. KC723]|nr:hypothetical protein E1165_02470 [Micromonospora sp. KC723]
MLSAAVGFIALRAGFLFLGRYFAAERRRGWAIASRLVPVGVIAGFAGSSVSVPSMPHPRVSPQRRLKPTRQPAANLSTASMNRPGSCGVPTRTGAVHSTTWYACRTSATTKNATAWTRAALTGSATVEGELGDVCWRASARRLRGPGRAGTNERPGPARGVIRPSPPAP